MAKISTLTLDELYARKITPSVEKEILKKDTFWGGNTRWCENVCKLQVKNPANFLPEYFTKSSQVDILVIQEYKPLPDSYGKSWQKVQEKETEIIYDLLSGLVPREMTIGFTHLFKCLLDGKNLVKGKAPSISVLSKCKPYLWSEIQTRKPKVIVSLATSVTKVLANGFSNSSNHGEITKITLGPEDILGTPMVITLSPRILVMLRQNSSGKFWGPDFYSVIRKDFEKAINVAKGELRVPNLDLAIEEAKKKITIARSLEEVEQLCTKLIDLGFTRILSYDTETTGVDPYSTTAKIITAQFGFRNDKGEYESYVFPLWHRENKWYNPNEAWRFITPLLESVVIEKIGHNLKFDILYTFTTTGIRIKGAKYDTLLLLHAINSGLQGCYGLKQAIWDWLPEIELGGYEDKLPGLTKLKKVKEKEDEESSN